MWCRTIPVALFEVENGGPRRPKNAPNDPTLTAGARLAEAGAGLTQQ